jgi:hypothetical protein
VLDLDQQEYILLNKPQTMQKSAEAAKRIPVLCLLSGCKRHTIEVVGEAVQEALPLSKSDVFNLQLVPLFSQIVENMWRLRFLCRLPSMLWNFR